MTSPIPNYICCPWVYHTIATRYTCYNHALDVIVLVSSIIFQTYNIVSYDVSYDYGHMPFYYSRNKRKEKEKKKKN